MSKTRILKLVVGALAFTTLSVPAVAAADLSSPSAAPAREAFTYLGGEAGWEPAQHKYVLVNGRLAHSEECDHAIREVRAPTRAEIERTNALYPG